MVYSLQRLLIILGLVIIPFYEIFLRMLPFTRNMAPDSRIPKEFIALVFSLSIGLLAIFEGTIKPFRNKFILIIPVFLLFNLIMCPHVPLVINNIDSGDFYFWKPFSEILCFIFMIISISSIDIDFNEILKVMVICATVMAGYVVLQKLGLDQFWSISPKPIWMANMANSEIGGNLGQKTIVASWLVMIVPLAIHLKKFWMALLIITGVIITGSSMAILALILIGISYGFRIFKYKFLILMIPIIILFSSQIILNKKFQNFISNRMDGRLEVWKETVHDIHYGQIKDGINYSITGIGLGRFPFLFPIKNKSDFRQAHNDILEFVYDCGLVGGFLLLGGIFLMIKFSLVNISPIHFSILLSFIAILLCSFGSFPFQLGTHQFYSSVLVGLLNNYKIIGRV